MDEPTSSRESSGHSAGEDERRYRQMFEIAPVALCEVDLSAVKTPFEAHGGEVRLLEANRAALALYGAESYEALVAGLTDTFTPQWLEALRSAVVALRRGAGEVVAEAAVKRLSGEERSVSLSFVAPPGHEATLTCVILAQTDITERKVAEDSLRESEWRYREIFDNVLDALCLIDVTEDGRFRTLEVNPALERITGIPRAVSVGKLQEEVVPPEVAASVNASYRKCVDAACPIEGEKSLELPSGRRYFHSTIIPARDRTGQIHRLIGIMRDVTAQRRAEEEIRQLNFELEGRVRERTAQLEAVNKDLEAFAFSVSHDLRAPLRHIGAFIELLAKHLSTADEKTRHYLETIANSAQRMSRLIDDLLSFSRTGRVELRMSRVELGPLVEEVVASLGPDTAGRNINWQVGPLPAVLGDPAMLRVVFVNLLSNAVKFTRPRAEAHIEVGCRAEADGGVVCFVKDDGVGFDSKHAAKLFGVFQRLHGQEEFEGTGVGLANVHRIIERHGGRTWGEGVVDGGATFSFSLPPTAPSLLQHTNLTSRSSPRST